MTEGVKTIIYPVRDLARARTLCSKLLGVEPYMGEAYYVGFSVEGQDIGLDPRGHNKGLTGLICYWHVSDIQNSLQELLAAGEEGLQEVRDVGGSKLIGSVRDAEGNVIGLIQPALPVLPTTEVSELVARNLPSATRSALSITEAD